MPPRTSRAIVQTAPRRLELRELLVPDVDALERLIVEHITRIPGVASIRSSFALKQVLYTTAVPLS